MTLLELVNSAACTVMLGYMLMIATVMPHRRMWGRRLAVWFLTGMLGFQVGAPFVDGLSSPAWYSQCLHIGMAVLLVVWRREAYAFILCKFTVPEPRAHEMRRATDWQDLGHDDMMHVSGGRKP